MHVLIVESCEDLGRLWANHLMRQGSRVTLVTNHDAAVAALGETAFDMIILDLVLEDGSAFAISDLALYRQPEARVIFVTKARFFSDGSIFAHSANACAFVQSEVPPEDLAAIVEHYAAASPSRACAAV